jgi:hypothetical protein
MDAVFVHSFRQSCSGRLEWSNLSKEVASLVDQPIEATLGETQTGRSGTYLKDVTAVRFHCVERLLPRIPSWRLYEPHPDTGECVERLKEEVEKRKMPLSGEAIRMMNYVDDVATTMRRLLAVAPTLTNEERKRVSEYLRVSSPNAGEVLAALDKK